MTLTPVGDRVVIERVKAKETEHGIYIPEAMRPHSKWGRVISLGAGKPDFQFTVKPGDLVLLPKSAHSFALEFQEHEILILPEGDLLAVVTGRKEEP